MSECKVCRGEDAVAGDFCRDCYAEMKSEAKATSYTFNNYWQNGDAKMKDNENSLSKLQLDVMRELYEFVQEADSQAKIANSSDSQKIEKLLDDLDEAFPYLQPWNNYRVTITNKYVISARSREHCEQLVNVPFWKLDLDENLVNSETRIDSIVYEK
jgi:hypothetical protein